MQLGKKKKVNSKFISAQSYDFSHYIRVTDS